MSLRLLLAASAVLAFAAPALAQQVPPAAPAAEAKSAAEIEMEAKGEAFQARMEQMQGELETAISDAGTDQAKGMADVDAILARYKPDIDAFIADFETFIDGQAALAPDEATRAEMTSTKAGLRAGLSGMSAQIRAGAQAALAAQASAPAAPAAD